MSVTVLVVDDNSLAREEITGILKSAGYRCDCAGDGLEALKLGLRSKYDLIVTDIEMPRLDGLKLIARVRLSGVNVSTPVVVISAANSLDTVLSARDLSVQGYFLKPFVPEEILVKTAEIVGKAP